MGENDIIIENSYFVWEFNAWIKIPRKGMLEHIDATKTPGEDDASALIWKVNDMKSFADVHTMVSPSHHSMVWNAGTTAEG